MSASNGFVEGFADFWKAPSPGGLANHLHPDVRLVQPLSPPAHGLAAAQRAFNRILGLLPDLHGEVDRWSQAGDVVFIEFRLMARLGNEVVEWPVIDRFLLRDDKAVERVSYFDSFPLLIKVLKHPSTWLGWLTAIRGRP
ncbi:nuclear transport factor 2 family protein [Mycobacterium decipiens]|uniref:SnoaL-like domain-containing protein n=1 Tax=Mycobacterium decipiens TaxID=1430326 RepID=A0A1X2LUW3_9MYCO|nr:nuclear transport factor 2 family protein [Mycobacterium decipiens]OSC40800.1 hypothetical protein B8W66_11515 [Mycobacterium decipiens]